MLDDPGGFQGDVFLTDLQKNINTLDSPGHDKDKDDD